MFTRIAVALLLLLAAPATAANPSGVWVFRAGDKALFLFEINRTANGWTGVWAQPAHWDSDGDNFSNVAGPVIRRKARSTRVLDEAVELTFDDPRPGEPPANFRIRILDANHAEATLLGTPVEPFALVRQLKGPPLGGWDEKHTYVRVVERPTNAEMTAIFEADQKARENWSSADHLAIAASDRQRRLRTQALLDSGALKSGDDYYHAAFVFQHGEQPGDFLKANIMATISVARGKPGAIWIAAATLDRYLQTIGQPQVLGTQFQTKDGKTTQQPFDKALLSDALRQAMHVPTLDEQEEQRRSFELEDNASAKP